MAAHDLVADDRLGKRRRQVDHDVALPELEIHGREPVERGRELRTACHRHVERRKRLGAYGAGLLETVARLESGVSAAATVASYVSPRMCSGARSSLITSRSRSTATSGPLPPGASLALAGTVGQPPRTSIAE
jgi:hypothetical protein